MMVTLERARASKSCAPADVGERFRAINARRTESRGVAGGSLR